MAFFLSEHSPLLLASFSVPTGMPRGDDRDCCSLFQVGNPVSPVCSPRIPFGIPGIDNITVRQLFLKIDNVTAPIEAYFQKTLM